MKQRFNLVYYQQNAMKDENGEYTKSKRHNMGCIFLPEGSSIPQDGQINVSLESIPTSFDGWAKAFRDVPKDVNGGYANQTNATNGAALANSMPNMGNTGGNMGGNVTNANGGEINF